jgi:hypothetical protein
MPKLSNSLVTTKRVWICAPKYGAKERLNYIWKGSGLMTSNAGKRLMTEMPMNVLGIKWKGTAGKPRWVVSGKSPYPVDANGFLIIEDSRNGI